MALANLCIAAKQRRIMKNKLLKIFTFLLCLPALFLCACGETPSSLPSINVSRYYGSGAITTLYNDTNKGQISIGDLTSSKVNTDTIGSYVQIELSGNRNWLYKMYIDCITFYVYTNESRDTEMIVNVSISNLADENNRNNAQTFSAEPARFKPTAGEATLCTINVGKVVSSATDANSDFLKFDILNCVNSTVADSSGNETNFKWTIYGLTIYGESRSYSK